MIGSLAGQLARGIRDRRAIDRGVRILTYHGVVERRTDERVESAFHSIADFRAHLAVLRRCHVVPIGELEHELRTPRLRPRVAITFDDGFRNNLIAAELLTAAKLPATIFVATDNVTRGEPIWPILLRLVLARGSARTVRIGSTAFELDREPDAFSGIRAVFKAASAARRAQWWEQLTAQLGVGELDELIAQFPSLAMMSWHDARALASAGIAIGSHGARHELHHREQLAEVRAVELTTSRAQIERELRRPCAAFAFPNGDTNPASAGELESAGYTHGFTMVPRAARTDDDPRLLPRLVPGGKLDKLIATLIYGN